MWRGHSRPPFFVLRFGLDSHQLDSQEDRLNTLAKEIADLQAQHDKADQELDQMIQQITMDERF